MKFISIFNIAFFFIAFDSYPQNELIADSLYVEYLNGSHDDSTSFYLLSEITFNRTHPDSVLKYAKLLVSLADKVSADSWMQKAYFQRGNAHRLKGNYELAFNDYYRSLEFALKNDYRSGTGAAYCAIADTYSSLDNSSEAIKNYRRGISELRNTADSIKLAAALLNAGDEYVRLKKLDSALVLILESSFIYNRFNYRIGQAYSMGNMGLVYAEQKNYELAEINLLEATDILNELGDGYAISAYWLHISDIYLDVGELRLSLEYAKRAYEVATDEGLKEQIRDAAERLSKIYDQMGKSNRALNYLKVYVALRDSMNNEAIIQKMSDLRREFEVKQARAEERSKAAYSDRDRSELPSSMPNYYALIIGIDDYLFSNSTLLDLDEPINDARLLSTALMENYNFKEENILLVENPNRSEVIEAFELISERITEKDNLLIFYAGHGVWDDKLQIGYWLPTDATTKSKVNWISNSTVRDYISGLETKHTLLISDACFSGSIFKSREVSGIDEYGFYKVYKMSSRKAMTSGTLSTVPDQSRFMHYLIKTLNENSKDYLMARQLFHSIEMAVINNTRNVPQYGTIQNAGDEGGDFIFIRRNALLTSDN